jgi:thioesterase domain-containing protein/acyl carrier protein
MRGIDPGSPELALNQERLMKIWNEILDTDSLSMDDDFFRSGGNSLAAIELLIKIQREFHLNLPPDSIYLYPTIKQQAHMIAQTAGKCSQFHPLIVPIHKDGALPPLFCFHPVDGWIGQYQAISPFLDQKRPVFGIRARGLEPGEKPVLTIEEAAKEYADAIKTVQKIGPYCLLGFSAGSISAFEVACQLQNSGDLVTYLGIIDYSAPSPQKNLFNLTKGKGSYTIMAAGYHLYCFVRNKLKKNPDNVSYSLFIKSVSLCSRVLLYLSASNLLSPSRPDVDSVFGGENDGFISTLSEQQKSLVRTQRRAISNYKPRVFSGNIILFSTGMDLEFYPGDPARGWNEFISSKTIVLNILGDHETIFKDPFCEYTATKIEESLKQADNYG